MTKIRASSSCFKVTRMVKLLSMTSALSLTKCLNSSLSTLPRIIRSVIPIVNSLLRKSEKRDLKRAAPKTSVIVTKMRASKSTTKL